MTLIFSFTAGIGLFLILSGVAEIIFAPKREVIKLADLLLDDEPKSVRRKTSLRAWLKSLLKQARAPISVSEFVFVSAALGGLMGLGMFLASGALLLALVMVGVGAFLYYFYLIARRDTMARRYEEAQPQVVYAMYFYLKANGLNIPGMVKNLAEKGPEIVREDWKVVAAAMSSDPMDVKALNEMLSYRNSPGFTRILEALLLFHGDNSVQLPRILEGLRQDISVEVEIARESATHVYGARRQLLMVALMPVLLSVVFVLLMPGFKAFYQSFLGQALLLGTWVFSGAVYFFGAGRAAKASMVRPYEITFTEERRASVYIPQRDREPADTPSA